MILDHFLVKGEIKEIFSNIYAVLIDDDYDRAMLFCRYQEYYESPFAEIKNKSFTLEEYMKIYSKKNEKPYFTYPDDWTGFNIPSHVLLEAFKRFSLVPNGYDDIMANIIECCQKSVQSKIAENNKSKWYLIGVKNEQELKTLYHEIAHGLYYINSDYKSEMDFLSNYMINKSDFTYFKNELKNLGYSSEPKIILDEIQAYLSTEPYPEWDQEICVKYQKEFERVFLKYYAI